MRVLIAICSVLSVSLGAAVGGTALCSWAFGFDFSMRYVWVVWFGWWILYATIYLATPQKIEISKGDEDDE